MIELREATRLGPEDNNAALLLGRLYLARGDFESANALLRRHVGAQGFTGPEAHLLLASAAAQRGRYDEAREWLEELRKHEAYEGLALAELARVELRASGAEAAIQTLEESGLDLTDPQNEPAARQWIGLLLAAGEVERARAWAEQVAESDSPSLQALRGDLLLELGEEAAARAVFEAALEADPESGPALAGLGQLEQRTGNAEAALALFERALAAHPGDPNYSYFVASAQLALGQQGGGGERASRPAAQEPRAPPRLQRPGLAARRAGRRSGAGGGARHPRGPPRPAAGGARHAGLGAAATRGDRAGHRGVPEGPGGATGFLHRPLSPWPRLGEARRRGGRPTGVPRGARCRPIPRIGGGPDGARAPCSPSGDQPVRGRRTATGMLGEVLLAALLGVALARRLLARRGGAQRACGEPPGRGPDAGGAAGAAKRPPGRAERRSDELPHRRDRRGSGKAGGRRLLLPGDPPDRSHPQRRRARRGAIDRLGRWRARGGADRGGDGARALERDGVGASLGVRADSRRRSRRAGGGAHRRGAGSRRLPDPRAAGHRSSGPGARAPDRRGCAAGHALRAGPGCLRPSPRAVRIGSTR